MTYRQRFSFLMMLDSMIVISAIFFSRIMIEGTLQVITMPTIISSITLLITHHLFAFKNKLYKKAWEYASVGELIRILKAVTYSIGITFIVQGVILQETHFRLLLVTWMLHMLLIGGSRFCWRIFRDNYVLKDSQKRRALIIGAGSAGMMVARQLKTNSEIELFPVAFIDDNDRKHKLDIMGIPVIGGIECIETAVRELNIDDIVIAIPSLSKKELNTIFQECAKTSARTQILPLLEDLVTGKVSVSQFREVQVEDLLGREPVKLDIHSISEKLTDKVVLVTGAGGSIGSEICRQVIKFQPQQLVLLGHGENSIYSIEMELRDTYGTEHTLLSTEIADIQDEDKMMAVMERYRPHVVYHAAAHKHVPLMERNPEAAVKNNVLGTMNVAKAASKFGVGTFVMISTDKAVNPTSVMGSSKRMAEMIVQSMNRVSDTKFVAVRFGNVLGSRGSVIPRFKKQIQSGGPVTVTHPEMVRYFMTIPEASRLVLQAGALADGGEIFVLDMGEPVKIVDLARNLIKLSGNSIDEIGIEFSGIRPGEKLFEELLKDEEVGDQQIYPKIYVGKTSNLYIEEIEQLLATYEQLDPGQLREAVLNLANRRVDKRELMTIS